MVALLFLIIYISNYIYIGKSVNMFGSTVVSSSCLCCCQPRSNLLHAGDIRLVARTCNKSVEVVILFQICQTTGNKQCKCILISA